MALDLPGFTVKTVETKQDGRRYMVAENGTTNVVVSLTLEQVASGIHTRSCRQTLDDKAKHPPLKIEDVRFSQSGDLEILRYTVPEFQGKRVNQQSMFACQFYDSTYIDLHVSRVDFVTADEPLFADILKSIHIEKVQRTSKELLEEASQLYLRHDYKGAIEPYSRALELEKTTPQLEKTLWYVLVDNLGMSYGITGDLQNAKATFEYGVKRDPTYPIFYYNLACTYSEMGDSASAATYLKTAFEHKANMLPGETMPDPRTDSSFKHLMKNREFRELAERLATSQ